MGREIELKIPLSKQEFDFLFNKIYIEKKDFDGIKILDADENIIIKSDEYFSRHTTLEDRIKNNEPKVIRIRTEKYKDDFKAYFCIKHKSIENGIENNREDETFVENPEVIKELFEISDYIKWFHKEKSSFSSHCCFSENPEIIFHLELVNVNGLLYAETEVTEENENPVEITKKLELFNQKMGLDLNKKDERSWYKIISEMNN